MDRRSFLRAVAQAALVAGAAPAAASPLAIPTGDRAPARPAEPPATPPSYPSSPGDRLSDHLILALAGDCLIARRVSRLRDPGFLAVRELLRGADLAWGNCEQVFADPLRVSPAPKGEDAVAIAPTWGAEELAGMGFGLMGTANNHALDYGYEGLYSTWAELDRAGIAHAGTGLDLAQAARPAFADTANGRVADVNCASSYPDFFAAGPANPWVKGRAGVNPLKVEYTVQFERDLFERLKREQQTLLALGAGGDYAEMAERRAPPDLRG